MHPPTISSKRSTLFRFPRFPIPFHPFPHRRLARQIILLLIFSFFTRRPRRSITKPYRYSSRLFLRPKRFRIRQTVLATYWRRDSKSSWREVFDLTWRSGGIRGGWERGIETTSTSDRICDDEIKWIDRCGESQEWRRKVRSQVESLSGREGCSYSTTRRDRRSSCERWTILDK